MKKAIEKYEKYLLNEAAALGHIDEFFSNNEKCELIIDYIVEWFNESCQLESIDGKDVLVVRFGEKYYNKTFDFTHGVFQRVRGIVRDINEDERLLYLLSDTSHDEKFKWSKVDDADREFIKALKDNGLEKQFSFELEHNICGFCFGELDTLLNIILDKEDKLREINCQN